MATKKKQPQLKKVENIIAAADLETLNKYVSTLENLVKEIGNLELKKLAYSSRHNEVTTQFNQFSSGLEHKYGKVSIDIKTGAYKTEAELLTEESKPDEQPNKKN